MAESATTTKTLVFRNQWVAYMNTGTTASPTFSLIGDGFTSFPESKNPKEYTRQYIHEKSERSDVVGYAPSIEYSCDVLTNDPVITKIVTVTDTEATGTATHVDIVSVNLWEGTDGANTAYKRTYAIIPGGKGDGTETLVYTGTLKAVGDITKGTFATKTSTFTADAT